MAEEKEEKKVTEAPKADKAVEAKPAKKASKKAAAKKEEKKEDKALRTEAKAQILNYGATPRKVRLVADLIRGKDLDEAYAILENVQKLCGRDIEKLVRSAAANAINNFHMPEESLYVAEITVGDGAKLKRIMPRAKGSASGLVKRWSNIYVTVKNREAK
jgi:large subunit ribosomal protein L22